MKCSHRSEGMAKVWIILIVIGAVLILAAGGYFGYRWYKNKQDEIKKLEDQVNNMESDQKDEEEPVEADLVGWKTIELKESGGSVEYPPDWIASEATAGQIMPDTPTLYNFNNSSAGYDGGVAEYSMKLWLTGPEEEDMPYQMSNPERQTAYATLKKIYSDKKLTTETTAQLKQYGVEFFGYVPSGRTDLSYIVSYDGKSRGFSFVDTHGQDAGLSILYSVALYNPDKEIVLSVWYLIPDTYTEIKQFNDQIDAAMNNGSADLEEINNRIHQEFQTLIETTPRMDLSFGVIFDNCDKIAKSLTF